MFGKKKDIKLTPKKGRQTEQPLIFDGRDTEHDLIMAKTRIHKEVGKKYRVKGFVTKSFKYFMRISFLDDLFKIERDSILNDVEDKQSAS